MDIFMGCWLFQAISRMKCQPIWCHAAKQWTRYNKMGCLKKDTPKSDLDSIISLAKKATLG